MPLRSSISFFDFSVGYFKVMKDSLYIRIFTLTVPELLGWLHISQLDPCHVS